MPKRQGANLSEHDIWLQTSRVSIHTRCLLEQQYVVQLEAESARRAERVGSVKVFANWQAHEEVETLGKYAGRYVGGQVC